MSQHQARQAFLQASNRPALISPEYLQARAANGVEGEVVCGLMADLRQFATANREEQIELFDARKAELVMAMGYGGQCPTQDKPFAFAGGKAIVPVHGYLMNRFAYSWGFVTGYNFIRSQVEAAANDPDVDGIILDINSYGGTTAGCQETADAVFRASKRSGGKPIIAIVDSSAYSAAYWIASGADKMVAAPTAGCGSIGVLFTHTDSSAALDKMGVKITYISAPEGGKKTQYNSASALSPEDIQDAQTMVNKMYASFVAGVARNRDLSEEEVIATEARSFYIAEEALAAGLLDNIEEPMEAIESFFNACDPSERNDEGDTDDPEDENENEENDPPEAQVNRMATQQNGGTTANTNPETTKVPKIDAVALQAAVAEALASQLPQAVASAVNAERDRLSAIMGHEEAKDRKTLASALAAEGMSVEAAARILASAPKEAAEQGTNHFRQEMNNGNNPAVGAGAGMGEQTTAQADTTRLLSMAGRMGLTKKTA